PNRDPITLAAPLPGVSPEPLRDHRQALAWLTANRPVLTAAVEAAAAGGFDSHVHQLVWALDMFFFRQGHWHDWAATRRIALAAAHRLADPGALAEAHRDLGHALSQFGRLDEAGSHFRQALEHYDRLDDPSAQAHTHRGLAMLAMRQGRYDQTLHHSQRAGELYRAAGNRSGQAKALNETGWAYALLGHYQQTLTFCQQALALFHDLGDLHGEAATLDS